MAADGWTKEEKQRGDRLQKCGSTPRAAGSVDRLQARKAYPELLEEAPQRPKGDKRARSPAGKDAAAACNGGRAARTSSTATARRSRLERRRPTTWRSATSSSRRATNTNALTASSKEDAGRRRRPASAKNHDVDLGLG